MIKSSVRAPGDRVPGPCCCHTRPARTGPTPRQARRADGPEVLQAWREQLVPDGPPPEFDPDEPF